MRCPKREYRGRAERAALLCMGIRPLNQGQITTHFVRGGRVTSFPVQVDRVAIQFATHFNLQQLQIYTRVPGVSWISALLPPYLLALAGLTMTIELQEPLRVAHTHARCADSPIRLLCHANSSSLLLLPSRLIQRLRHRGRSKKARCVRRLCKQFAIAAVS